MTTPSCATCFHVATVDHHERCLRHQKLATGYLRTMRGGFSTAFERDATPDPERMDGDKCGPQGKHWSARA